MAVRLRMKKMGRRHRPFFRIVAVDGRAARDGKVIEYLGHYDPLIQEADARVELKTERVDYWLGVGAQPSDKVGVLIKKYGTNGTHLQERQDALERLAASKPMAPPPVAVPTPKADEPAAEEGAGEEAAAEEGSGEAPPAEAAATASEDTAPAEESPAEESPAAEEKPAEEPAAAEASDAGDAPAEESKE